MSVAYRALILEVIPGSEPITGRLGDGDDSKSFRGWLQLAVALQAAVDAPVDPRDDELPS